MDQDDTPDGHPEDRIEAALERIARQIDAPDPVAAEVTVRLDHIIATMRQALGK